MAIDGVAPRAKLNQQRSRIFRAALEAVRIQKEKGDKEIIGEHKGLNSDSLNTYIEKNFNSNQIIPGTEFMQKLKIAQQYNIYDRKNDLTKIASNNRILYLETFQQSLMIQISLEYGADADLIVLGLSTHEPYFYIIRETIIANDDIQCSI